jgi:hypothetical protein
MNYFKRWLQSPLQQKLNWLTVLFSGIFIIFTILMAPASQILQTSRYDIVVFEFSWTVSGAQTILSDWGPTLQFVAIRLNWLDYGWMIGYGGLMWALNIALARKLRGRLQLIGCWMGAFGIVAASLDAIENLMLLVMLYSRSFPALIPFVGSLCALVKFILVGCAIFWFLVVGFIRLLKTFLFKSP